MYYISLFFNFAGDTPPLFLLHSSMPELPEVETVRRFLQASITSKTINDIEILNDNSFLGDPNLVINSSITHFDRKGKQLSVFLDNNLALLFHLKMTGQLVFLPALSREGLGKGLVSLGHPTPNSINVPNRSTRVIFTFQDG